MGLFFDIDAQLPLHGPVALVAHDAGAASHIAAWFSSSKLPLRIYAEGPARSLFQKVFNHQLEPSLTSAVDKSAVVVTGSGWASDLEHRARKLASSRNIPSVAVLDHWANYSGRFHREGEESLPSILWVSDEDAAALAAASFPNVPVLQLPNIWLEGLCMSVQAIRWKSGSQPRRPARRLLYLLEPIRVPWIQDQARATEVGEFQGLRYWFKQLPHLILRSYVAPPHELECLALRPHPSEPVGKYDDLIAEYSGAWPVSLDSSPGLAESLALADAAFGCETQALVAAMACHLPAFSTVPPWAPPCRLPQDSLHHLSRLEGL